MITAFCEGIAALREGARYEYRRITTGKLSATDFPNGITHRTLIVTSFPFHEKTVAINKQNLNTEGEIIRIV